MRYFEGDYYSTRGKPAWTGEGRNPLNVKGYLIQIRQPYAGAMLEQRHIWFHEDSEPWAEEWIRSYTSNLENIRWLEKEITAEEAEQYRRYN